MEEMIEIRVSTKRMNRLFSEQVKRLSESDSKGAFNEGDEVTLVNLSG